MIQKLPRIRGDSQRLDASCLAERYAILRIAPFPGPWTAGEMARMSRYGTPGQNAEAGRLLPGVPTQEDARQFTWNADGAFVVTGPAVDLTKQLKEDWAVLIDWRIDQAATGPVMLSFGGAAVDIAQAIRALPTGSAVQTRIPLRCFAQAGAKFDSVGVPICIQLAKGFVATIRNVNIETTKESVSCPGKAR